MNYFKFFLTFLLLISFASNGQSKYEFFGTLQLNGSAKSMITYRLEFSNTNGKISGFSITDIGGAHETKNIIVGTYDKVTKAFSFKETDIIYTKSELSSNIFCFVNFTGKVDLNKQLGKIEGNFKGLYKNKTKCIDGTLTMAALKKITETVAKYTKKVKKSSKFDDQTKEQIQSFSVADSLTANKLTKGQNLNLFVASDEIEIEIWDSQTEDGDRIDLYHNTLHVLDNYTVTSKRKIVKVKLPTEKNVFRITALNEGARKFNTTTIRLVDNKQFIELTTNLNKGENASITIVKK
jgi:hypothetical protein